MSKRPRRGVRGKKEFENRFPTDPALSVQETELLKIVILGPPFCGKTNICRRFCGLDFQSDSGMNDGEEHDITLENIANSSEEENSNEETEKEKAKRDFIQEVDKSTKKEYELKFKTKDDENNLVIHKMKAKLMDTAGQLETGLYRYYTTQANVAIILIDVTATRPWQTDFQRFVDLLKDYDCIKEIIVVASKCDLFSDEKVKEEIPDALKFRKRANKLKYNCDLLRYEYFMCSARTKEGLKPLANYLFLLEKKAAEIQKQRQKRCIVQ